VESSIEDQISGSCNLVTVQTDRLASDWEGRKQGDVTGVVYRPIRLRIPCKILIYSDYEVDLVSTHYPGPAIQYVQVGFGLLVRHELKGESEQLLGVQSLRPG